VYTNTEFALSRTESQTEKRLKSMFLAKQKDFFPVHLTVPIKLFFSLENLQHTEYHKCSIL
jgi:hypothetical protein